MDGKYDRFEVLIKLCDLLPRRSGRKPSLSSADIVLDAYDKHTCPTITSKGWRSSIK